MTQENQTKVVYKIVSQDMYSIIFNQKFVRVKYKLDKFVVPEVTGTLLTAFESFETALDFIRGSTISSPVFIYKAEGEISTYQPKYKASWRNQTPSALRKDWYFLEDLMLINYPWPKGTVLCTKIKLVSFMHAYNTISKL